MGKDYDATQKGFNAKIERDSDDNQVDKSDTTGGESGAGGGEDDSSTEIEGDDSHLHEDQKSRRLEV
ncbi:hypothetical protein U1763_19135 [Sphingomonas sp. LB2R24]|uniref:hypothetical protein n=1 Tax=Sphingomonas sorbitolis TaxID=3096165 RepID=UPI002FC996EE